MKNKKSNVVIVLDPELEDLFQKYQASRDLAGTVLGDDVYERRAPLRGYSGGTTILRDPSVAVKYAARWNLPRSKSAHAQRVEYFDRAALAMEREWNNVVNIASEHYGNHGPLVSGVYRGHFPDDVKRRLRFLAQGRDLAASAARAHRAMVRSRSPYFQ